MSFILDALKKSESDRQRQSGPSLFEVKVAPPRRKLPVWAVAIAVLLGINIIVISWMLLRHPAAPPAQQAAAGTAPAAAPPSARPNPAAGSGGTVPMSVAGRGAGETAGSSGAAAPPAPPATAAQTPARVESSSQAPAAAPPASSDEQGGSPAGAAGDASDNAPAVEPAGAQSAGAAPGGADGLPLYQQIVSSDGLPELHLDLHVFAGRPQDRFVMINMHRLGEGDSLPGGVQVEAIRPDGVVLNYRGTRFLLPRN